MKPTIEIKGLLRTAHAEFRTLNRNRNLSPADKKQLKTFYLAHVLSPRAQKLLRLVYPIERPKAEPEDSDRMAGRRLLTARELEAWLQIDMKTIYAYAKKNRIPHIKVGTSVRFPEREVREWLRRQSYVPPFMKKRQRHRAKSARRRKR